MSKLANPWKCDASNCGILRANDTNHWLVISAARIERDEDGTVFLSSSFVDGSPTVCIEPWNDERAEAEGTKHACGIDCALKITAQLIVENFFPADSSAGKEVADGA
jgi:hypothetical protein